MTLRRFLTFQGVLWIGCIAVAVYLLAWPPVEGLIAVRFWTKTPCYVPEKAPNTQFYFEFNGKRYYSPRLNLWMVHQMVPVLATQDTVAPTPNATCFVQASSAGAAANAVLDPTAGPGPALFDRLSILLLAVVAVALVHYQIHRARRMARAAAISSAAGPTLPQAPASGPPEG